jgi:thiamine biosynthesis protein ThiS
VITVNQRDRVAWHAGLTVAELLTLMTYTYPHIIVSIDSVLVPYDTYDQTPVPDESDVRVIHLMAGG